jgi:hypothetical protein
MLTKEFPAVIWSQQKQWSLLSLEAFWLNVWLPVIPDRRILTKTVKINDRQISILKRLFFQNANN